MDVKPPVRCCRLEQAACPKAGSQGCRARIVTTAAGRECRGKRPTHQETGWRYTMLTLRDALL